MGMFTILQGVCYDMPPVLIELIQLIINLIKIVVPVVLIVLGMLDMGKAVFSQKDEDIKTAQNLFVKRLVAAVAVFLIVVIVQFVIGAVANVTADSAVIECLNHIINNL